VSETPHVHSDLIDRHPLRAIPTAIVALARVLAEVRDELRRANDARDDLYREVVSTLAHLRQDTPKTPGEEG
jgi:hypothetical protein